MNEQEQKSICQQQRTDLVWQELLHELAASRPVNLAGLPDPLKSWLALTGAAELKKRLCIIVPDELRARALAADLNALTDEPVLVFRPRELNLAEVEAASHEMQWQRLAILHSLLNNDYAALIVPAAAALQKIMPPELLQEMTIQLRLGQQIEPDQLAQLLSRNGFEQMRLADGPGQFARRGDIIDLVLPGAEDGSSGQAIRISFFDNEIDAIKEFDLETQRSGQMLQQVQLAPVHELLGFLAIKDQLAEKILAVSQKAVKEARAGGSERDLLEQIRRLGDHDAQRVAAGIHFAALDRWLDFIYPQPASVLDYLPGDDVLLVVDEPLRVRNRADAAQAEFIERIRTMLAKGQVLAPAADVLYRGLELGQKIDRHQLKLSVCQIASSGNGLPGARQLHLRARPTDSYRGREEQLWQDLKDFSGPGKTAWLFAGSQARKERLAGLALEHSVPVRIDAGNLARGFVWPEAGLMLVGAQDIFGSERRQRRRSRHSAGLKIDFFSDLVPGELVVHEVHGIGKYEGLFNLDSSGSKRDYLKISYAGADSLYIPTENLDQIQKYVGADSRQPKLSKLGGQAWNRLKEKARSSIRKLATDLVRLYAERAARKGNRFSPDTVWQQEFEELFPFEETEDQLRSIREIKADMESEKVMERLLCGDVGYGKTEVAFRAMFKCVMDGQQAAFLAPTTVLAQQHYENLLQRLAGFPLKVGLLSRFVAKSTQKATLQGLKQGSIDIVIGTHRILSNDVHFKKLGLLLIDEEQRFGVDHKEKIKSTWPTVDVLYFSATPIPRTLHMAMAGIRDISVLEEPPQDRRPVQTYVMEYDLPLVSEAILREIGRKGQVFYLFNDTHRIEEKAAELEKELPGVRILTAHGKMNERTLEDVILAFIRQEADILVCTTIIESGIDMPNVNTIIVENADRLGLAQLYQLRGRVGRSDRQAYAYVTYRRDKALTEVAEKRLAAIRDFTELGAGFKIALRDLEVRGAGNLLGAEQHGHIEAIGYDLYCRILDESVREIQGKSEAEKVEAVIDLEVDAFVDRGYIVDEGQRMDLYRRLANLTSLSDYQDVLDECLDRYGDLPPAALALADIAYVRSAAARHGFARISQQDNNIVLAYAGSSQPDMEFVASLLGMSQYKGRILFNAGQKPYLLFRQAAADKRQTSSILRQLFAAFETTNA